MNFRNLSLLVLIVSSTYALALAQTPVFRTFSSDNFSFDYPEGWHVNDRSTSEMQQFNVVPDSGNVLIMVIVYKPEISSQNEFSQLLKTASKPRLLKVKQQFSETKSSDSCLPIKDGKIPGHRIDGLHLGKKSSVESYSLVLRGKFINLVYMKEDTETTKADLAWKKLISTLDIKDMKGEDAFTSLDPSSPAMLTGEPIKLPIPPFSPSLTKYGGVTLSATIKVRVTIDKDGNVTEAEGVSGDQKFLPYVIDAAKRAKFAPTFICGELQQKVTRILTYKFVPR